MKCQNCGKPLEQKGNRERLFCDDKCRMMFKRSKANKSKANIQSEQPKIQSEQVKANKCKSCGCDVLPLIDVCRSCVDKGITYKSLGLPDIPIKTDWGNHGEPNYLKLKLERNEIIPYILWCLKEAKVTGNSSITVLGKTFNWGKKKVESIKGQVSEFRADMLK